MVGHLVIDATPKKLGRTLARLRGRGIRLNLNLLGEAVLGDDEADRRLGRHARTARARRRRLRLDQGVRRSRASCRRGPSTSTRRPRRRAPAPAVRARRATRTAKFINLDMEEYRDLDLTIAVFERLARPAELRDLEAGHRAAGLPARRARARSQGLTDVGAPASRRGRCAASRCASSRARTSRWSRSTPTLHGWPLATWRAKPETDANYKRAARLGAHTRAHGRRAHRRRRPQPLRRRVRAAARAAARGVEHRRRRRDAARHGDRPGRGRAARRRRPAALHAGRAPATSSTSRSATSCAASRRTRASENFMSALFELGDPHGRVRPRGRAVPARRSPRLDAGGARAPPRRSTAAAPLAVARAPASRTSRTPTPSSRRTARGPRASLERSATSRAGRGDDRRCASRGRGRPSTRRSTRPPPPASAWAARARRRARPRCCSTPPTCSRRSAAGLIEVMATRPARRSPRATSR